MEERYCAEGLVFSHGAAISGKKLTLAACGNECLRAVLECVRGNKGPRG